MKVVLYYPRITPHVDFPTWEPLQLLFLARALRDSHNVVIVDGRLYGDEERRAAVERELSAGGPVCLGITALTCYQLNEALDVASFVRSRLPHVPVIFGGWHATIFPEDTLRENAVDIVVRGQGEMTLREVVGRLEAGNDCSGVPGVSWKRNGAVVHEDDRPLVRPDDLQPLSVQDFNMLDIGHYQTGQVLFYMSSIGCQYACSYCSVNSTCGRKWLPLSAEKVCSELHELGEAFGFREIIFWDNIFFPSKKRVMDICSCLEKRGIRVAWSAHARINEIITWDDTFLESLKKGGCRSVFIGVESASQRTLDRINKGIRADDILPVFRKLKAHDISVATNWLVGLPEETHDDVRKTMNCIRDGLAIYGHDVTKFMIHIYRFMPFPGTSVYSELSEEELSRLPRRPREWATFIHEKISDGMEPWKDDYSPSLYPSSTFYLWKAYLQKAPPVNLKGRVLHRLSKFRAEHGFFRFPWEWWLWKKTRAERP